MNHKHDARRYYTPMGSNLINEILVLGKQTDFLVTKEKLRELELKAVSREDYEKAAYFRDLINSK